MAAINLLLLKTVLVQKLVDMQEVRGRKGIAIEVNSIITMKEECQKAHNSKSVWYRLPKFEVYNPVLIKMDYTNCLSANLRMVEKAIILQSTVDYTEVLNFGSEIYNEKRLKNISFS